MKTILRSPVFRYSAIIFATVAAATIAFPTWPRNLFSAGGFMPHSFCYVQNPRMIWLHVSSDTLIGLAYVAISCTLGYLVLKASAEIPFHWMFLAFGVFIISCGMTHFMEILTVWRPVYWLAGYVKVITAVASVFTAFALFQLMPKIFGLIESVKLTAQTRKELTQAHFDLKHSHEQLAAQKAELEIANQELEMFTYSAAHDLRAPLRGLQGFSQILQEECSGTMNSNAIRYAVKISTTAKTMETLLSDLLEYSRISRTDLDLHPVSVRKSIDQAIAAVDVEGKAERKPVIDINGDDIKVVGNTTMITQVLTNLLSNAIKFVPSDANPEIIVRIKASGETALVEVTDNGIGIADAYQARIFKLFERLHSGNEYPGTGIGLAIVQRAIERMGGKVGVNSRAGHGSTFWFELTKA